MIRDAARVTVLIPARNEQDAIERCLRAVLRQDHPHDLLEVVVVDGGSVDDTVEVAKRVLNAGTVGWKVLHNPVGSTPSNLNAGLRQAEGDIICRVDARSIIPIHYVRTCSQLLTDRSDVAVVGGAQVARTHIERVAPRGIARALRNPYATGLARYRRAGTSGPADTVYLGAFRADQLRECRGWDERLLTNQDYDLNARMRDTGVVWFEASLAVEYSPRSTYRQLAAQYRRFGRWKAASWMESRTMPARRQQGLLAAALMVSSVLSIVGWRRPVATVTAVGGGLLAVDALGREPGGVPVRLAAGTAIGVVGASWVAGVLEQVIRHVRGDRLLGGRREVFEK